MKKGDDRDVNYYNINNYISIATRGGMFRIDSVTRPDYSDIDILWNLQIN